ncbi:MAG: penicillin-binding protein 1C [Adhaeribacter sp.]
MKQFISKSPGKSRLGRLLAWLAGIGLAVMALLLGLHLRYPLQVKVDYSPVVLAADGSVLNAFLSRDDKWRMQLEAGEINPLLKKAVLLKEDRYFYYHPGVNPVAMVRALFNNLVQGRKTSGASTLTMQVARLLYPRERTYAHKLSEIGRAFQLEWQYSKEEILTLYLNLVPYGGNIEGVKAASVLYFQQSPRQLSLAQAVTLTVIPNKPSSLRIGKRNEQIRAFRDKWLRYYQSEQAFSSRKIADALSEPLSAVRQQAPRVAPHFAWRMRRQYPGRALLRTTLNRRTQEMVEQLAFQYLQRTRQQQIHNISVIVVNNQTRAVEAYLGSADFGDQQHGGQVDGVRALRSPGSTLKPYLYAVAFDKGLLTPKTRISDVPVDFAGYRPENYFGDYSGNVTVEQALATSLNIPAVKVLDQMGVAAFVRKMQQAEFSHIKKTGADLGLSLILGGCDVKLEELTALYAAFADQGRYRPLRWQQSDSSSFKKQLISPASAYMLYQVLSQLKRPDLPHNAHNSTRLPQIAWKTGTSYGRKDAWSIGYNSRYTVGVWVGNFTGEGVPELNGTDTATPLLFDLFNAIDYNSARQGLQAPAQLAYRAVCPESGKPRSSFCTGQVRDAYIPGISPTEACDHQKQVWVSADEKYAYCTTCLPETGYQTRDYPNHAPELLTFFASRHLPYQKIPEHNPRCPRIFQDNGPVITSPTAGMEYLLERADQQQLMLRCNTHNEVRRVSWYINDRFLQTSDAKAPLFFQPRQAGSYKISCTDDQGRNSDSYIKVAFLD